jgi:hypothetical protein
MAATNTLAQACEFSRQLELIRTRRSVAARRVMEPRDIMVFSPLGSDPTLAIAASRGGAIGVLDLEFASKWDAVDGAYSRLARFAGTGFGVQLRADSAELQTSILASSTKPARIILVGDSPELPKQIADLRAAGIEAFVSAVTMRKRFAPPNSVSMASS